MKVKDLLSELQKQNPEALVVVILRKSLEPLVVEEAGLADRTTWGEYLTRRKEGSLVVSEWVPAFYIAGVAVKP